MNYDVVIVGAGPGGLNCARVLAEAGKKVLLLERKSVIGQKVCAGGLTRKGLTYLNLPKSLIGKYYNTIAFEVPLGERKLKLATQGIATVDRVELGGWLADRAKEAGAKIKTNATVTKISKEEILVNNKETVKYHYLVGGDGVESVVRKYLKLPVRKRGVLVQYIIPRSLPELKIFFNSQLFHSWYAWVFPHKNYTSVGCGVDPRFMSPATLQKNFQSWLQKEKIDLVGARKEGYFINYDYRGCCFDNIFLVGDAAGLTSGFSGEGMYQALISGEEAAKKILDPSYSMPQLAKLVKNHKTHNRLLSLLFISGPFRNLWFDLLYLLSPFRSFRNFFKKAIM